MEGTMALASPRGIVHKLNKAQCNKRRFHTILDVYNVPVLCNTTPRNHASAVRKLPEQIEIFALNSHKVRTKF